MRRKVSAIATSAALLVSADLSLPAAEACAPAPPAGKWVRVANESAVVVWDHVAKREHFIRKASFRSTAADFGFLVPTPSKPELAEIDDGIFDDLAWATRPRVETRTERSGVEIGSAFLFSRADTAGSAPAGAVRVLDEATVGGYDAVVLEADDEGALATWLAEHGYDARPALVEWLAPYVARKWILTAFKVASPKGAPTAGTLGTRAVRMSFDTETPFFPYREPTDQRAAPPGASTSGPVDPQGPGGPPKRELVVYVVAAHRITPSIGDSGVFPGQVPFAKRLGLGSAAPLPQPVAALLPAALTDPFVSVVVDPSTPRPGTDELLFRASPDEAETEPPPVVHVVRRPIFIPIEGLVLVAGFGVLCVHLVRRTRRSGA